MAAERSCLFNNNKKTPKAKMGRQGGYVYAIGVITKYYKQLK